MWTHRDDSVKRALTVHLIADVVVGSNQRHARILHAIDFIFIRHHKHQANPKTHKARTKTLVVRMQTACTSSVFRPDDELKLQPAGGLKDLPRMLAELLN